MSLAKLTVDDVQVRDAVVQELDWDPRVDASAIGVAARHGAVTLTGYIDTYAGKLAAERAAKRVKGVRAVANDMEVRLRLERTDTDIADDAARILELHGGGSEGVQVAVHHAHVTITGIVDWLFQKQDLEATIRHVRGVRGISNRISVAPRPPYADVRNRIALAMAREADLDARQIRVAVSGHTVTLTGKVPTWRQRDLAEHAAAIAPGIRQIDNRLEVEPVEPDEPTPSVRSARDRRIGS